MRKNSRSLNILVTGATGFIGSHTVVELLNDGYKVIGIDNFTNSSKVVLERIKKLSNNKFHFEKLDIRDKEALEELFKKNDISSVIHFAGYKAVGESVGNPLLYFSNNLKGTVTLLEVMNQFAVKKFVFSSSCTVYGTPSNVPVTEEAKLSPENPYGRTKTWIDEMLNDISLSDNDWSIISLRYFNPIGAHPSGILGEDPTGKPNNLLPFVTQTAIGRREKLLIFGDDYPTPDGTCIRDYIHVQDLAIGHLKALEKIFSEYPSIKYVNIGTGKGYSVLDIVKTFEDVNQVKVPFEIAPRRAGDAPIIFADPSKANSYLGWKAEFNLEEMLRDAWNFQKKNPKGY